MQQQIINLVALGTVFLVLFILCEWLYHRKEWQAEHTRKVAHAGSGLLALFFPVFFVDYRFVILLCSLFLLILVVTKRTGLLRSIHGIPRISFGSTMFPFVVCLCFWRYSVTHNLMHFYLPVLIMSLADPAACLVGKRMPMMKLYQKKTLGGSLAFFFVAFGLTMAMGIFMPMGESIGTSLNRALLIGFVTTVAEALSGRGFDNLTIPIAALALI
jgi:phytol kinase